MKKKVICLSLGGVILGSAVCGWANTNLEENKLKIGVFYTPVYFKWSEKDGGETLLTEKGWIHKGGIEVKANLVENYYLKPSLAVYGGDIKYDGGTWDGKEVKSRTNYSGYEIALAGGIEKRIGKAVVDGYVKVGMEKWKRSIDSNFSEEGSLVFGYGEKWKMWYWSVGINPSYDVDKNIFLFGNLYVKRPFSVKNKVDIFDVEVEPKKKWNYGIEVGIGARDIIKQKVNGKISFFYEREKFGKSDLEYSSVINDYVYQPESKREQYGVKLEINF